jgi:hypothetical protein
MAYVADVANSVSAQIEAVKTDLEQLFEQTDQIAAMIKKTSRVQKVSRYIWRMPVKLFQGGVFGKYVGNGNASGSASGSLGGGNGLNLTALEAAYYYSVLGYRVTQEQIDTSSDSSQSVINVLSDTLANAMVEAGVLDDITFHTKGDGVLTNQASSHATTGGVTVYTFAGTTDYIGVSRLREGMSVAPWDSTLMTHRLTGVTGYAVIKAIDYDAKSVTLDQTVSGAADTDILVFRGMDIGTSTPLTFSSGYPGTPPFSGQDSVGGDSFRHGFPYMTDTTSSNYFYGKQKSSIPQLLPARVNAQSNALEWDHGHRLIAKLIARRNPEVWKGLIGIANTSQRAAVFNLGIAISTKLITGTEFGSSVDLMPSNMGYEETFNFCGIPCYLSKRQDRSRIDFINPTKIGRAQLFDTKFFDLDGRTTFVGRDSNGFVNSYIDMFIVQAYDFVGFDSGSFGVIDSLALPNGWDA